MSQFDVTDPGLVNVADQAYPPVPPDQQALPTPRLVNGSDFAPPPLPTPQLGDPTPSSTLVANAPYVAPSASLGVAVPAITSFDVGTEIGVKQPVAEWLVTQSGNFATNNTAQDMVTFTITAQPGIPTGILAFDVGLPTERYQIFLGPTVNLYSFGLDLTQSLAMFLQNISQLPPIVALPPPPVALPPRVVNPTRAIASFGTNWILVYALDDYGYMLGGTAANPFTPLTQPTAGQQISINIVRDAFAAVSDTNLPVTNVTVAPTPVPAVTTPAVGINNQGNITALDGVVAPFIGTGVAAPPFLGTFEVESQTNLGQGLPTNVFV